MVPESKLEKTEHGRVPEGEGWFVLGMRDAEWRHADGRGAVCVVLDDFEGERRFDQLGVNPFVLGPGEPMALYHWEADQEDFLVVSGEAVLVVEGEERQLRAWDFVHCPPNTKHVIVGAGSGPCLVIAVGARGRSAGSDALGFTADEAAKRHGASVEEDTMDPGVAYGPCRPASRPRTATAGFPTSVRDPHQPPRTKSSSLPWFAIVVDSLRRMTVALDRTLVTDLAAQVSGPVLAPTDSGYDAARAVHNGLDRPQAGSDRPLPGDARRRRGPRLRAQSGARGVGPRRRPQRRRAAR